MSIPRFRPRKDYAPLPQEADGEYSPANPPGAGQKTTAAGKPPLHVVYVSGGTDLMKTVEEIEARMIRQGLRYACVTASPTTDDTPSARKQAFLDRLRSLFESGQIGEHTRIIVQMHGGIANGKFFMQAKEAIDMLTWDELRQVIRHPTERIAWRGEVIVGCCRAGLLGESLPVDEGNYVLLAGKKRISTESLIPQLKSLIDFMGEHLKKKKLMPSSARVWNFLSQTSGENIRRVDAGGLTKIRAGSVRKRKPKIRTTGSHVLAEAQERQPAHQLIAKIVHGSVGSVISLLSQKEAMQIFLRDPMFKKLPPLGWVIVAERDIKEKAAAMFAAGLTEIRCDDDTVLHQAIILENAEAMKALLALNIDIDTPDQDGQTALHLAAQSGNETMASLLIENGADLSVRDNDNKTALDYAEHFKHTALIELLEKHAAMLDDDSFSSFSMGEDDDAS